MFKNLKELIATMPDEKTCRNYLVKQRWNGKPVCPYCGHEKVYVIENGKRFKCASSKCYKKFTVTVGTIFEASNVPLSKWLPAIYLCTAHKKGISSYQLAKDIGVSQKTGWFMLHRIRALMVDKSPVMLSKTVEADETYMARKYRSDYKGLPPEQVDYNMSNRSKSKGVVLGLAQRGGQVRIKAIPDNNKANIWKVINENVKPVSNLYTDESALYKDEEQPYNRKSVNHSRRQWVSGNVHTNTVENFWSVMKRGVFGIYHQISYKHLQRYCDEFSYRYNSRKINDVVRFKASLRNMEGRLKYDNLIGKK